MAKADVNDLLVPLAELRPYERNPRRGDVEAIKRSLRRSGQYRPVVVNRRSMAVLAGNHTLYAARDLGWSEIAATFVDVDEETAKRIVLADNRTSDLAGYDDQLLVKILRELPDLDGTGYDQAVFDALIDELDAGAALDDDGVPTAPAKPRTRPGDLYRLGRHRLVCGDARAPAQGSGRCSRLARTGS
jgi:ParB-like chromosome segregation protein Spo0J